MARTIYLLHFCTWAWTAHGLPTQQGKLEQEAAAAAAPAAFQDTRLPAAAAGLFSTRYAAVAANQAAWIAYPAEWRGQDVANSYNSYPLSAPPPCGSDANPWTYNAFSGPGRLPILPQGPCDIAYWPHLAAGQPTRRKLEQKAPDAAAGFQGTPGGFGAASFSADQARWSMNWQANPEMPAQPPAYMAYPPFAQPCGSQANPWTNEALPGPGGIASLPQRPCDMVYWNPFGMFYDSMCCDCPESPVLCPPEPPIGAGPDVPTERQCPGHIPGWVRFRGHMYYLGEASRNGTWIGAEAKARASLPQREQLSSKPSEAFLVEINSAGEQLLLVELIRLCYPADTAIWIGANSLAEPGRWVWSRGQPMHSYTNWSPLHDVDGRCGELRGDSWFKVGCDGDKDRRGNKAFIAEKGPPLTGIPRPDPPSTDAPDTTPAPLSTPAPVPSTTGPPQPPVPSTARPNFVPETMTDPFTMRPPFETLSPVETTTPYPTGTEPQPV